MDLEKSKAYLLVIADVKPKTCMNCQNFKIDVIGAFVGYSCNY